MSGHVSAQNPGRPTPQFAVENTSDSLGAFTIADPSGFPKRCPTRRAMTSVDNLCCCFSPFFFISISEKKTSSDQGSTFFFGRGCYFFAMLMEGVGLVGLIGLDRGLEQRHAVLEFLFADGGARRGLFDRQHLGKNAKTAGRKGVIEGRREQDVQGIQFYLLPCFLLYMSG